jgi:hypothetical protein
MTRKSITEKFADYEQLREQAHRKVDTMTRQQLRKFITSNGPVKTREDDESTKIERPDLPTQTQPLASGDAREADGSASSTNFEQVHQGEV